MCNLYRDISNQCFGHYIVRRDGSVIESPRFYATGGNFKLFFDLGLLNWRSLYNKNNEKIYAGAEGGPCSRVWESVQKLAKLKVPVNDFHFHYQAIFVKTKHSNSELIFSDMGSDNSYWCDQKKSHGND